MKYTVALTILSALLASQVNAASSTRTSSTKSSTRTSSTKSSTKTSTKSSTHASSASSIRSTSSVVTITSTPTSTPTPVSSSTSTVSYITATEGGLCGGIDYYAGPTVCAPGLNCISVDYPYINPYESTCANVGTTSIPPPASTSVSGVILYHQCGGQGYTGPTVCAPGLVCVVANEFFSTCQYATYTTSSSSTAAPLPTVAEYAQCGGINYTGVTLCATGLTCVRLNDYFYQCLDQATSTA